jgi:zinc protease
LPKDGGPLAWSGETALLSTGFGKLDLDAIDRLVTGKRISWKFAIDESAFELSGETRAADLREQLYLLAAKLRYPRWDAAPIERLKAGSLIGYDSYLSSPAALLERDQQWLLRGQDVRWKSPDKAEIAALTPERFRAYWEPVLASGPVELMLFGDFTRKEALAAIAETFGALPKRGPVKLPAVNGFAFPAPTGQASVVRHRGDPSSAAAIAAWPTAGGIDSVRTGRELYVLADIFNDRLFEQLRSEAGASYSPQAYSYWPQDIAGTGQFVALSQTTPDKVDVFYRLVEKIAADLRDNPVSADDLARVVTPLRNLIERALTANQFWLIQLKGATYDQRKFDNLRTFLSDHSAVTPERLQQLARQYLIAEGQWRHIILPEQADSAAIGAVAGNE